MNCKYFHRENSNTHMVPGRQRASVLLRFFLHQFPRRPVEGSPGECGLSEEASAPRPRPLLPTFLPHCHGVHRTLISRSFTSISWDRDAENCEPLSLSGSP